jgi:alkylation response protein AidB-like acyl-CoA dehydrogenase
LLIEKEFAGVNTRQMKCSGVWPSGTTYITFEDVKVPVENLIGEENHGFLYIMYNFNHERWSICAQATRFARVCYEGIPHGRYQLLINKQRHSNMDIRERHLERD